MTTDTTITRPNELFNQYATWLNKAQQDVDLCKAAVDGELTRTKENVKRVEASYENLRDFYRTQYATKDHSSLNVLENFWTSADGEFYLSVHRWLYGDDDLIWQKEGCKLYYGRYDNHLIQNFSALLGGHYTTTPKLRAFFVNYRPIHTEENGHGELKEKVRNFYREHPEALNQPVREVSEILSVSYEWIYQCRREFTNAYRWMVSKRDVLRLIEEEKQAGLR